MKQLQDIDFRSAYGPVPDGFSRSVQQALHQTKEEPMKKFTLRTAVMAVVTVLVLTAVAFAANEVINPTVVPTPITQFQPVDSGEGTQEEISPSPMATRRPVPDFDEIIPFRAEPSDCNGLRLEIIDATYENGFLKGTWKISTRTPDSSFIWESTNQQINNVVFLDHTETEEFSGHYLLKAKCLGLSDALGVSDTAWTTTQEIGVFNENRPSYATFSFEICKPTAEDGSVLCPYSVRYSPIIPVTFEAELTPAYRASDVMEDGTESMIVTWEVALVDARIPNTVTEPVFAQSTPVPYASSTPVPFPEQ